MAVATMIRSAGSPWNSDKRELAIQMAGESGSSSAGRLRFSESKKRKNKLYMAWLLNKKNAC